MSEASDTAHGPEAIAPPGTGNIGGRVAKGTAILWVISSLARFSQLITTAICARLLTPSDYGVIALAVTVTGFVDLLSNLQISSAVIRVRHLDARYMNSAFTLSLIRGVLIAVILAAIAGPAAIYMDEPRLQTVLLAMAIPSLISCLNNPYLQLFARDLNFFEEGKRQAVATLVGAIVAVAGAFVFRNYWAIVLSSIAMSATFALLSYVGVPGRPWFGLSRARDIASFGTWLLLIGIIDYINGKIDYFYIGRQLGTQTLGAYHVGQQITLMATGDIVQPLNRVLLPAFSMKRNNPEDLRRSYMKAQSAILAVALPVGFGVSAVAQEAVYLVAGPQWSLAIPVITWLAPLIALQTILAGIEAVALSMDRGRDLTIRTAVFLLVRGSLISVGFWMGGFMGIIYARIISGSFFLVYGLWLAASITGNKVMDPVFASWRSILSVIAMYVVIKVIPSPDFTTAHLTMIAGVLALKIAAGAACYGGLHFALWIAAGQPDGVESRVVGILRNAISRRKSPVPSSTA